MGNHDYGATGAAEPTRFGAPGSPAVRSIELARERLPRTTWPGCARASRPRGAARCSAGTAVRATRSTSTSARPTRPPASPPSAATSGLAGHTHVAAAWRRVGRGAGAARIQPGEPLALGEQRWLLNPGAVGAPRAARAGWWEELEAQAAEGAWWLLLDLEERIATWRRAPFDPAPARARARALGLDDPARAA